MFPIFSHSFRINHRVDYTNFIPLRFRSFLPAIQHARVLLGSTCNKPLYHFCAEASDVLLQLVPFSKFLSSTRILTRELAGLTSSQVKAPLGQCVCHGLGAICW